MTVPDLAPMFESFDVELTGFDSGRQGFTAHLSFTTRIAGLDEAGLDAVLERLNPIADAIGDFEDADWRMDELDRDEGPEVAWWTYLIQAKTPGAIATLRGLLDRHTPLRADRVPSYQATGDVPASVDAPGCSLEDGGQALIVELDEGAQGGDEHMFVRLQSWHEGAGKGDDGSHPALRALLGRRVRVTVEDLGPAGDAA